jgi:spectinomycin phosphotransferase
VRARPDELDESSIADALREGWGFEVAVATYAAVGGGSYHWEVVDTAGAQAFVTVDDLGQKAWLGETRDEVFDELRCAFDTSAVLWEGGLDFVVGPIPARDGGTLRRLDARYSIALFPFVDGEAGTFGHYDVEGRLAVLELIAELHLATTAAGAGVRIAGLAVPGRHHVETALRQLDEPWTGGPLSEPTRAAVRDHRDGLIELLALADRLSAEAQTRGGRWVVTHGEPHAANVIQTSEGRVLVDWDTVAVAPPERDLWMLVDPGDPAELYVQATGRPINDAALDFFRLAWDLGDLAEYLSVLRSSHQENDDTLRQYGAVVNCGATRETWSALLDPD